MPAEARRRLLPEAGKNRLPGARSFRRCFPGTRANSGGRELALFQVNIAPPAIPRAVLKRLGPPPLGPYAREFQQLLASYYQEISCRAYELAYAGDDQEGPETGS
ncbi:hypothetical protein MTAT_08640 [Moorella thermoacetica]|uniref:Uncharacterized protein n=1 Tax=Neomoorella thermoacetica TaxID=1525 RepID=A0AAC9HHH5_NEOTH|nr:hypothetical protein [Moorella thermoacetica]AOQ24222.1 hypothetical protein Maut_01785 [Moorella thermoacetica]TYL14629.1 hypothetical protein MTAT_08640 [Moorella thermoacetica]